MTSAQSTVAAALKQQQAKRLVFCATAKSGLGHLRRMTNIARALKRQFADAEIGLVSNAPLAGLEPDEKKLFSSVLLAPRDDIAALSDVRSSSMVVVDTAVLPGLHRAEGPLCLVLRETVPERLADFRLKNGRQWDLVCVPNPPDHWMPESSLIGTKRQEAVGWIYRRPGVSNQKLMGRPLPEQKSVLIAAGGGGNARTAEYLRGEISQIVGYIRDLSCEPVHILQAVGPRASEGSLIKGIDGVTDVGAELHSAFTTHDLVISTAGYNSVLELAQCQVPVLLVPIPRTFDDQFGRARKWAPKLGQVHDAGKSKISAKWITDLISKGCRRKPCHLEPCGADRCAELLWELAQ